VPNPDPRAPLPPGDPSSHAPNSPQPIFTPHPYAAQDRWNRGAWLFRDSTLQRIEFLLDEAFRVPGTRFRFGLDGIIGLVPGLGDVLVGLFSLVIPVAGWMRGVPYITLVRMIVNVAIGVLIGSVPILGDLFDVIFKANRRNYRLLLLHLVEPRRHTARDWGFLLLLAALLAFIFALPILLVLWILARLAGQF
jgi:hypothetical protein